MSGTRWITAAQSEAKNCHSKMPWERGLRRQAFINRRKNPQITPVANGLGQMINTPQSRLRSMRVINGKGAVLKSAINDEASGANMCREAFAII